MSEWEKNPRILVTREGHQAAKKLAAHTGEPMGKAVARAIQEKLQRVLAAEYHGSNPAP